MKIINNCILHNKNSIEPNELAFDRAYTLRVCFLQDYIRLQFFIKIEEVQIKLLGPYKF